MSYTFSRRDFMKYTAVAAVAVAGSSMFTGCSLISNPNRPTGKVGDMLKPGSKICNVTLLGGDDKPTYDNNILTCKFNIYTQVSLQINVQHFQVQVVDKDDKVTYYNIDSGSTMSLDPNSNTDYAADKTVTPTLKTTIANLTDAETVKKIQVVYLPKLTAKGKLTDAYSDVYATWELTPADLVSSTTK